MGALALRSSIPAIATPLSNGEIDIDGVGRFVEHVLGHGASVVVVLGLSGELSAIPPKLRAPLIRAVLSAVAGRAPVLVASGRASLSETEAEIEEAIALGATAILVAPSSCFGLYPQEVHGLFRHLSRRCPLPLFYYHLPSVTRAQVTPKLIHALRQEGLISGIKDSSGNAAFLARTLSLSADDETFRVFLGGSHYLLGGAAMGVHGVISSLGQERLGRGTGRGTLVRKQLDAEVDHAWAPSMARQARLNAPNTFHHVMVRGIERTAIFRDDIDRTDFIARVALTVNAWALLSNHAPWGAGEVRRW